jgi:diguanylate cyclase (GGDEF)-like protein/PAS domain S-box-containing protein
MHDLKETTTPDSSFLATEDNFKQSPTATEPALHTIGSFSASGTALPPTDAVQRAVHKLRLHQAELQLQNDELRRTNEALEMVRARYVDLYEQAPMGYCTLSDTGLITQANCTAAAMLAMTQNVLCGQPIGRFIHIEDQNTVYRHRKQLLTSGERQSCELRITQSNGTIFWANLLLTTVQSPLGEVNIHAAFNDISEHKKVEESLREQGDFFRLIAENLDGYVAVLDLEGKRVYNSPSYTLLLGDRQSFGTSSFVEVHPNDRERVMQAFQETVQTGIGRRLEYRFVLPDGSIRQMESRSGAIRDNSGRVRRVAVVSFDITERKQTEEQVRQLAFVDPLTKLPNRRLLNDRLAQTLAASKRSGDYSALMFLDLDNFKPLNDTHGHAVGDLLLIEAAARLKSSVREMDSVARFGGDEFVVILAGLESSKTESKAQANVVAEKIRAALCKPYLLVLEHETQAPITVVHHCSVSIGVSLFMDHDTKADDILKWADIAMYQAKDVGRNAIRFYDEPVA